LEKAGGRPEAIKGPHVTQAAKAGDELAIELLRNLGRAIGEGCASIAAVLDPEVFVIGGGVIAAGDLMLGPAREAFAKHLTASGHRPLAPIVAADMANDAGIVGAAALAREAVPLEF
jgi:glucokinase